MPQVDRFSVSLDTELLAAFDTIISARGYTNRSEAIRDLIRELLTAFRSNSDVGRAVGVLTFSCSRDASDVATRLREILSSADDMVRTTTSVVADTTHDVLTITLCGETKKLRCVADHINALRGIEHSHLALIPTAS